jgi:hypothetical protein
MMIDMGPGGLALRGAVRGLDVVLNVRDRRRGDDLDGSSFRLTDLLGQPLAGAEDDRDDAQVELVEQAGGRQGGGSSAASRRCA